MKSNAEIIGFYDVLETCKRLAKRGDVFSVAALLRDTQLDLKRFDDLKRMAHADVTGQIEQALRHHVAYCQEEVSRSIGPGQLSALVSTGDDGSTLKEKLDAHKGRPELLLAVLNDAQLSESKNAVFESFLYALDGLISSGKRSAEIASFVAGASATLLVNDSMESVIDRLPIPVDGTDAVEAVGHLREMSISGERPSNIAAWLDVARKDSVESWVSFLAASRELLGASGVMGDLEQVIQRMAESGLVSVPSFSNFLAALAFGCSGETEAVLSDAFHVALLEVMRKNQDLIPHLIKASGTLKLWKAVDGIPVGCSPTVAKEDDVAYAAWLYALQEKHLASHTLSAGRKLNRIGARKAPDVVQAGQQIVRAGQIFSLEKQKAQEYELVESERPDGQNILLLCERGADPSVYLSSLRGDETVTLCTMDSDEQPFMDRVHTFWSLRDMSFDASDEVAEQTAVLRSLAETAVSNFVIRQSFHRKDEVYSRYSGPLSAALEDSLDGSVVIARSMLNAIKAFDGKNVVLALRSNSILNNFLSSFLGTGKNFHVTFGEHFKDQFLKAVYAKSPKEIPADRGRLNSYLTSLECVRFPNEMVATPKPDVEGPAVVMTAFSDPLYADNTMSLVREVSAKRPVVILEMGNPIHCYARLVEEFGSPTQSGGYGPAENITVFAPQAIFDDVQSTLVDPKGAMADLAGSILPVLIANCSVKGLDLTNFFRSSLAASLFKTVHHFGLCARLFQEFFRQSNASILYAGSERAPIRMVAVEAAKSMGVSTVDVMSVNTIRLPRYRAPSADYLTSIDSATTQFLADFYGAPESRIVETGSPRMALILKKIEDSNTAKTREVLSVDEHTPIILYACQLQPIDRCVDILQGLLESMEGNDARLLVKLHRRENVARREIHLKLVRQSSVAERVHVISEEAWLSDITNLIAIADVVVSMYSNALREAACHGIPVIAADWFETPLPFDFPANGLGVRATSSTQMVEFVKSILLEDGGSYLRSRNERYLEQNPQLTDGSAAKRIAEIIR